MCGLDERRVVELAPDQPLYCSTDSACVSNPVRSNIGCCPDSSINCPIWTTCYESSERAKYTTNNGLSLWCGDAAYPHCLTHSYAGDVLSGYQLLGCGRTGGSDVVYYSTTGGTLLTTTRPKITDSASKADTTATSPPPQTTSPASPPTGLPIGTIVGGVVGGVAALGLITLGAFFLLRRGKQPTDGGAHATAASHPDAGAMYGGALPPPMAKQPIHQAQYGSFAPVDHRSSVANGSYYGESIGPSPSTNPPLHGPDPMYLSFAAGSPPSSQEQGTGYGPVMHHQNGPAPASHRVAELDTSRGDRELRELE